MFTLRTTSSQNSLLKSSTRNSLHVLCSNSPQTDRTSARSDVLCSNSPQTDYRPLLKSSLRLCSASTLFNNDSAADSLLAYLQAAFFTMGEGNYPFASNYITGAVGGGGGFSNRLPAWPMRVACGVKKGRKSDIVPTLASDLGIDIIRKNVGSGGEQGANDFDVVFNNQQGGEGGFTLQARGGSSVTVENVELFNRTRVGDLLSAVAAGVMVWYNVSGTVACLDWSGTSSINVTTEKKVHRNDTTEVLATAIDASASSIDASAKPGSRRHPSMLHPPQRPKISRSPKGKTPTTGICSYNGSKTDPAHSDINFVPSAFSWGPTVCNDQMFLVNTDAQGKGNDRFYFPAVGPDNVTEACGGGPPVSVISAEAAAQARDHPAACAVESANEKLFGLNRRDDVWGQEL